MHVLVPIWHKIWIFKKRVSYWKEPMWFQDGFLWCSRMTLWPQCLRRGWSLHPKTEGQPNWVLGFSWWSVNSITYNHVACFIILTQDEALTSRFCAMVSNGASKTNADGFRDEWDEYYFWEGAPLGESIFDNGLLLVWSLKMNYSHGYPTKYHSRGDCSVSLIWLLSFLWFPFIHGRLIEFYTNPRAIGAI